MKKLDADTTKKIIDSMPAMRGRQPSSLTKNLSELKVGESLMITKEEISQMGYKTPFKSFGNSIVQAATYQGRSGHKSVLYGYKFSVRTHEDKKFFIRIS